MKGKRVELCECFVNEWNIGMHFKLKKIDKAIEIINFGNFKLLAEKNCINLCLGF